MRPELGSGFAFVDEAAPALSAAGLASTGAADSVLARLRLVSPSFLKSVSYQPDPESRNAGAVTRRRRPDLPHSGQSAGSASLSFCRRSKW